MTRPRRDPRAERAARLVPGSARPRLDLARPTGDVVGPSGRPRRDLRAELRRLTVAGGVRPRLDRAQTAPAGEGAAVPAAVATPKVRVIETPAFVVVAVVAAANGRLSAHEAQVIGAARRLADGTGGVGADGAVVVVAGAPIEDAGALGADRLLVLSPLAADAEAERLARLIDRLAPRHVLLPHAGRGADLARRLAARLGETPFLDAEQISPSLVVRTARAGAVDRRGAPPRLLTVGADRVAAHAGPAHEARAIEIDLGAVPASRFLAVEEIPADPATVPLSEAGFVVSAGNGVVDFATFRRLAAALGATPGASRVVCDAGAMPRAAQVGASGTVLTADVYLALGISGAPQHLQGIGACPNVIAVNTDLHAAMIERAGLAVVADAQVVMPAILAALAKESDEDGERRR